MTRSILDVNLHLHGIISEKIVIVKFNRKLYKPISLCGENIIRSDIGGRNKSIL